MTGEVGGPLRGLILAAILVVLVAALISWAMGDVQVLWATASVVGAFGFLIRGTRPGAVENERSSE